MHSAELPHPAGLLSKGVELGGQVITVNGRTRERRRCTSGGRIAACCSAVCRTSSANTGDRLRPYLARQIIDPQYDKFSALRAACWSSGQVLYVPRGVVVNEPLHMLSVLGDGGTDISQALVVLEEGAEATLLCETDGHSGDGRRASLRSAGDHSATRLAPAGGESAELGTRDLALRPSQGGRRTRRLAAVDDCRDGQPPGEGQSACGADRRRRQLPGERRHVHGRQAAHRLSHTRNTTWRPTAAAISCTRVHCRTNRGRSGGA